MNDDVSEPTIWKSFPLRIYGMELNVCLLNKKNDEIVQAASRRFCDYVGH